MNSHENNENKINQSPFSYLQNKNGRGIAEHVLSFLSIRDLKNLKLSSKDDYQFGNMEIEKRKEQINKQFFNPNNALNLIHTSSPEETMRLIARYQSTESFKLLEQKYNKLISEIDSENDSENDSEDVPELDFQDVDQILGENAIKLNHSSIKELADINTDIFNLKYENKISPIEIICLTLSMIKVCRRMSPRILLDALICSEPLLLCLKESSEERDFFYWNLITTLKACIFMGKDNKEENKQILRLLQLKDSDSYLNLSGIYLREIGATTSLRNINFSHSELRDWIGSESDLSFSNFTHCILTDIWFIDSKFQQTDFSYASFEGPKSTMFSPRLIDAKFNHMKGELKIFDYVLNHRNNMLFDQINFAGLEAKIEFRFCKFSPKETLFDNCIFLTEQLVRPNNFKKTLDQLAKSFASLSVFDAQKQSFCKKYHP